MRTVADGARGQAQPLQQAAAGHVRRQRRVLLAALGAALRAVRRVQAGAVLTVLQRITPNALSEAAP